MEQHKNLGKAGEDFACKYLKQKGLKVEARNVHAQGGEIDIVAFDAGDEVYILVEVKTRTHQGFALGIEAVGPQKQRKMQKAAAHYFLRTLGLKDVPVFELHAIILTPNSKQGWFEPEFLVEYYDDLS